MIQKFRRLRLGAWVARHLRTLFGLTLTKTDRGPWRLAWRGRLGLRPSLPIELLRDSAEGPRRGRRPLLFHQPDHQGTLFELINFAQ